MAKLRVHELAKELGITSKELMGHLKEAGEFVKSSSSSLEPPVVRQMREKFATAPKTKKADAKPAAKAPKPSAAKPAAKKPAAPKAEEGDLVKAPLVGVFYAAPAEDAEPFVKVGDKVKRGQTLCIVEAMKLMNEIMAEVDGEIVEICVANGQVVDYGSPLFRIRER